MYEEHPCFKVPDDELVKVWKYMDFQKFVSILDKKALFFASPELFEDGYEGCHTYADMRDAHLLRDSCDDPKEQNMLTMRILRMRSTDDKKEKVVVNCWHENNFESTAMWKLYTENDKGVAIQSNFKRLKECFDNCKTVIHIGKIKYLDYNNDDSKISDANDYLPFLRKRQSFEHEHEIRVIVSFHDMNKDENIDGMFVDVSLCTLIEKIYVYPTASKGFLDLVKSVSRKYGIEKKVIQSNLYDGPLY